MIQEHGRQLHLSIVLAKQWFIAKYIREYKKE
jgi:hypothetical protein